MGFVNVPLHEISLSSDLVTGAVKVGVRPSLPIANVSFLLGNDLAGGKVFPNPVVTHNPVVTTASQSVCPDDVAVKYPEVFHATVVTRAMAQTAKETPVRERRDEFSDLYDTFIAHPMSSASGKTSVQSAPLSTRDVRYWLFCRYPICDIVQL